VRRKVAEPKSVYRMEQNIAQTCISNGSLCSGKRRVRPIMPSSTGPSRQFIDRSLRSTSDLCPASC